MICKECQKANQKSRISILGVATTDMLCPSYYDEEGVYHHHDINIITESFQCSNNHRWTTGKHPRCPSCDWPNDIAIEKSHE